METHQWTNTAQYPSELLKRPLVDSVDVATMIGVPECAVMRIALKSRVEGGQAVTMTPRGGFSEDYAFSPIMNMSFRKEDVDYAQPNTVMAPHTVAVGRLHTYKCDGQTVYVAHWPNCQNLSVLERVTELPGVPVPVPGVPLFNDPGDPIPSGTVPLGGTLGLIAIGAAVLLIIRRGASK